MRPDTAALLDKASRAVGAAEILLREGSPDFAVERAYYAMFHAAEALLAERGRTFRRHAGVHRAFGEEFVKPGVVPEEQHRWLLDAFDLRLAAEYGLGFSLAPDDVREVIDHARVMVDTTRRLLGSGEG